MKFYVYELVRKSDGQVVYVGKGSGRRLDMHHLFATRWKTGKQPKLYTALRSLLQSGDDFFGRKVYESDNEGEVLEKELELIQKFGLDNLYNGTAYSVFGLINSEKAQKLRQAISASRKGMKFSDEHRENIRKALLARPPRTPEQRQNQAIAQTGIKHKKHSNALPPEEKYQRRLHTYNQAYLKRRESELERMKAERDEEKLQRWQAHLQSQGLPLDTPLPDRISPLVSLAPEQRLERKRARERLNHSLRRAKAAGDQEEIARLTAERRRLDTGLAESVVNSLL